MFLGPFSLGCGHVLIFERGARGDLVGFTQKPYLLPTFPTFLS